MSAWIYASEDNIRGNNQKKGTLWARVHQLYHESQAEISDELNPRNIESMKGRFKRLNENAGKWVAALEEANRRKRSGMSQKYVELEAHTIYEAGGGKFQDLIVYNDVMSKHPRWAATSHDEARRCPAYEVNNDEESGGSTKRSKTSENCEYHTSSNSKIPVAGSSTISRPIGRDKSKKKGKGKAAQSENEVAAELRAMRLSRNTENELIAKKLEIENRKNEINALKMEKKCW